MKEYSIKEGDFLVVMVSKVRLKENYDELMLSFKRLKKFLNIL